MHKEKKTIVISGTSKGVGFEIARQFNKDDNILMKWFTEPIEVAYLVDFLCSKKSKLYNWASDFNIRGFI